jgi:hypothetical protein
MYDPGWRGKSEFINSVMPFARVSIMRETAIDKNITDSASI